MGGRLEEVTPGALVAGIAGESAVTIVAVRWIGSNGIQLTYRTPDGRLDERLLYRDHEPRLTLRQASAAYDFTADGARFKLAAEALRIRMAARFDPMLAVHTSDLEALPHQIEAMYRELLERTPLRFLLADDPGAGKTIMAGEELADKFPLRFELLTRQLADATIDENVFSRLQLLIARMDQLSRSDDLGQQLDRCDWDLVVVDEARVPPSPPGLSGAGSTAWSTWSWVCPTTAGGPALGGGAGQPGAGETARSILDSHDVYAELLVRGSHQPAHDAAEL